MKIYIADNSPLYCAGIEQLLKQLGVAAAIASFSHFDTLQQALTQRQGAVLMIVDARLPGLDSLEKLQSLLGERRGRLLMLSDHKDLRFMRRLLAHGVQGTVAKTASLEELQQAIKAVLQGHRWGYALGSEGAKVDPVGRLGYAMKKLSHQENNVLRFACTGLRNKQIASKMALTEHTIKTHMSNILRKLEIENRTQLVVAIKRVDIDQPQSATA